MKGKRVMSPILLSSFSLMAILAISITYPVFADNSNSTNISYKNGGPSYIEVKNNLKNFLYDKEMNQNASNILASQITKTRNLVHNYYNMNPYPTLNQSTDWAGEKIQLAKEYSGYAQEGYTNNYQIQQEDFTKQLLAELQYYHEQGRNGVPAYTSCQAFHNCTQKPFLPSIEPDQTIIGNYTYMHAHTIIPLPKPEFANATSGYLNNTDWIQNLTDYQKFIDENKTK